MKFGAQLLHVSRPQESNDDDDDDDGDIHVLPFSSTLPNLLKLSCLKHNFNHFDPISNYKFLSLVSFAFLIVLAERNCLI